MQHQKTTLDNGLRIITASMPHIRSVSTCIYIGTGSRYEPDAIAGISHFIEHMLFRGTTNRPTSKEIAEAIEGVGGILNGATGKELSMYWCKVAQPHFAHAFEVLADMVLNAKFDPEDIAKERQIIIDEINMTLDSPSQRVEMLIDDLLWPNHPLGRDVAGFKESVNATTRDAILDYLGGHYQPGNTIISIAGNIDHESAVTTVSDVFGNWTNPAPSSEYLPYERQTTKRLLLETKATEQAHLCLGIHELPLLDPKRFALDMLNVILGEGMSSRLFTEVRDKQGLAYSIGSHSEHYHDSGSITIYAGVEPEKVETATRVILEQLELLKEPVSEAELSRAKELATGRLLLGMEDSRSVAGWLGGQEALNKRILGVDEVTAIINAVTIE
ncbi:MAG: insulinase family protein, partial [Chloroflexi bacterium]|nr:insulinase family protein [Chloroflexota bacterium]